MQCDVVFAFASLPCQPTVWAYVRSISPDPVETNDGKFFLFELGFKPSRDAHSVKNTFCRSRSSSRFTAFTPRTPVPKATPNSSIRTALRLLPLWGVHGAGTSEVHKIGCPFLLRSSATSSEEMRTP
jgi:hypothetical protein